MVRRCPVPFAWLPPKDNIPQPQNYTPTRNPQTLLWFHQLLHALFLLVYVLLCENLSHVEIHVTTTVIGIEFPSPQRKFLIATASLPTILTPANLCSVLHHYNFVIKRMSYTRNHALRSSSARCLRVSPSWCVYPQFVPFDYGVVFC